MSLSSSHSFCVPTKQVKSAADIPVWEKSQAYADYLGFLQSLCSAVSGRKIRDVASGSGSDDSALPLSPAAERLLSLLDRLRGWTDDFPPAEQQQRFGNKAYREWHQKLQQTAQTDLLPALLSSSGQAQAAGDDGGGASASPPPPAGLAEELSAYLLDSFGNASRIDYGTGHEMAFVMLLAALFKVDVLKRDVDEPAIGLVVFDRYMSLVRHLQTLYRMEPAGSQGVWALDDYQFAPFILGAAQFASCGPPDGKVGDPPGGKVGGGKFRVSPKSIPDYDMAEALAPDFHLFACIKYIAKVKTGPFPEHSNQLWNVSGVASWEKVHQGLIKMYRAEVLSKFPVIQHVYFGSLFTLRPADNPPPEVRPASARPPMPPMMAAGAMPPRISRPPAASSSLGLFAGISRPPAGNLPPSGPMSGNLPPGPTATAIPARSALPEKP